MSLLDTIRVAGLSQQPDVSISQLEDWRNRVVQYLVGSRAMWPGAPVLMEESQAWECVLVLEEGLRDVDTRLREVFGVDHLENLADPMGELLLIILARKTPEDAYLRAFERLTSRVDSWAQMAQLDDETLLACVEDGGLGPKKVKAIRSMLSSIYAHGHAYELSFMEAWEDKQVQKFLSNLDEVGPKSATCVMMYAMRRAVFPVDAHVGRLLMRLNLHSIVGLDLSLLDHKQKQRYLADLVPPDLRYSLHVNALQLGRTLCTALKTSCSQCVLQNICEYGLQKLQE